MTAIQLETTSEIRRADVRNPREYKKQLDLAKMITRFLLPMSLDQMAGIATDKASKALLGGDDQRERQYERDVIEVFACMQKQLAKVEARYNP